ncbi:MAG: polysaccharide pyruvyl transferase family protein [Acutalibacteraceae bacterium]
MKIKTITCHDVYNTGASLQAYALCTYLRSLGHDAEIIDYKPDYLIHYKLSGVANPAFDKPFVRTAYNLAKLPGRIKARKSKRKKEFDDFTREYLPVTDKTYASNEELKADLPAADVYFAGSDQIWNTFFKNGKDPAFYLDFVPENKIKASYAASFSTEKIYDGYEEKISTWLKRLDFVSVREKSGVALAESLGVSEAVSVLDPVFLLGKEQWLKLFEKSSYDEEYLLVYDFDRSETVKNLAVSYAKEHGLKIYSVLSCDWCDRCFEQEGPLGFLSLIFGAKAVLSNSFHATAFSLIFEKQFFVCLRQEAINTRMTDLLESLGLTDRIADTLLPCENIDYQTVNQKLEGYINDSKKYIDTVLKSAEDKV